MIRKGYKSEEAYDVSNISEADVAAYYLNIKSIPCLINSPLRMDKKPSLALYSPNGTEVNYKDFSTNEGGRIWTLLSKMWNCSYLIVKSRVYHDLCDRALGTKVGVSDYSSRNIRINTHIDLQCRVREWRDYDIEYWKSYGISLKWLKYADVYPISHKIVVKDDKNYAFGADKYAYAYAEFKGGKTTLKIYQPFNTKGYKWANRHDKSVISLWTKVPEYGERICVCSSLKDALCLWENTGIPSLAIQGEGYTISNTAVNELKRRYKEIYILLDNDEAGLKDGVKLSESTGFINLVLPNTYGAKDISDLYYALKDRERFKNIILNLFKLTTN